MPSFTCVTCHVGFQNGATQRLHYRCDWHRYNLKRKVAELPPLTSKEYQRRVLQQREDGSEPQSNKSVHCKPCRKIFGNQNAFENHLNSKKHKESEKSRQKCETSLTSHFLNFLNYLYTMFISINTTLVHILVGLLNYVVDYFDDEEIDSDEWEDEVENPIDHNNCLFCDYHSSSFLKNVKHMSISHSFFVPDINYCIDLRGLLFYLGEKITKGYMCLWCNEKGRTFHTAWAACQHMMDKGHCKMIHEGVALAEYADYYDYSTLYPDAEKQMDVDEEVEIPELDGEEYELVLPSGVTVGHRSLMRYYKQRIHRKSVVTLSRNTKMLHKVLVYYRALGWSASQQEAAAKKAKDIHHMKRMQSKWNTKLSVQANKLQTHFRAQVNF